MATIRPKAPFKRGTKLIVKSMDVNCGEPTEATYVRWWGAERAALIVVRYACPHGHEYEITVHVDSCTVKP